MGTDPYGWRQRERSKPFWVALTALAGGLYDWYEVYRHPTLGFQRLPGGRFGSATRNPAFDANGAGPPAVSVDAPVYARLQRAYFDPTGKDWVYLIVSGGGGGTRGAVDVLRVNGFSATAPNFYDVTVMTPPPNSITLTAGAAAWLSIPSGLALTAGDVYDGVANGVFTAVPFGGGPAVSRPLYLGWGGWVSGGGQCVPGGIRLTTY